MPYNYKKLLKNDTFCGHLNYSSPEMLQENSELFSPKLDIWAIGCCLYFLTSKKDPFDASSPEEIK
jgi:serine/threonine protein kinase